MYVFFFPLLGGGGISVSLFSIFRLFLNGVYVQSSIPCSIFIFIM